MAKFKLPKPVDKADRNLLRCVKANGWHVMGVFATKPSEGPDFAYTTGLFHNFGAPELFVSGFNFQYCAEVINIVADEIKAGKQFCSGQIFKPLDDIMLLALVKMNRRYVNMYMRYSEWFYQGNEYPVLQCIWTDQHNRFPWDKKFNKNLSHAQKLYGRFHQP